MGASAQRRNQITVYRAHPRAKAGFAGLCVALLVVLALVGYRELYRGRIFPGVTVAGASVGGMTPGDAEAVLAARLSATVRLPLVVEADGRRWELSRQSLGAHYDLDGLVKSAYLVGRTGNVLDRLITPAVIRVHPQELEATVQLGTANWTEALVPISKTVDRPAVDARLFLSGDHAVRVVPDETGAKLDMSAAQRLIAAALISGSTEPVSLPVAEIPSTIRTTDLSEARKQALTVLSGPAVVSYEGRTWELGVDQLQAALILPSRPGATVDVDPKVIDRFVQRVASDVDRPARSAQLVVQGDQVVVTPSQTARVVDQAATQALVRSALFSAQRTVVPVVKETPPAVTEADLASSLALARTEVDSPVVLNGAEGQSWTITPAMLLKMLALPADPLAQRDQTPRLDPAKLQAYISSLAKGIDRPAFNARFLYNGGQVQLIRDGISGQRLDQQATLDAIQRAAVSDQRTVALPIETVAPLITARDVDKLSGLQLIAENSTSYAGSIPPRRHNVELATSMLNGVVVAPGQIFSFNQELGPQTLARGFQVGYGIIAQGNGQVETVPSVGGGICQVSTTLFQPVFWSGDEIEERHWHAYWIAHYASHGYPGLDDTVDDASGLDFKFKNDTSGPLLIQSSTDGTNVHFALYGHPPTWTVHVDKPVITNVIKTDRQLRIEHDPTLAPGTKIYTEAAEDGFTVTVRRVVDEGNGVVRQLVLRSVYDPSHNVMAVGPTPAPKPTAQASATPQPSPTPAVTPSASH
jgi:vancomycin resistance protein YoaR